MEKKYQRDVTLEHIVTSKKFLNEKINDGVDKKIDIDEMKIFSSPDTWALAYKVIGAGKWLALVNEYKDGKPYKTWKIIDSIIPPHQGEVPKKDSNEMRTVYILENFDRVFGSMYNDYLFEKCSDMVHPQCKSYLKGVGTGKVDQELAKVISKVASECPNRVIACKTDMVHYFDTCPIKEIDKVWDEIRKRTGDSVVHDMFQQLHHTNMCFDMDNKPIEHFFSIGQGIAIASFFADAILYDVDKYISENFDVYYIRFSDDILIVGNECEKAFAKMKEMLEEKGLALNPKKTEMITRDEYFKFLGFAIRGDDITISKTRLNDLTKKVKKIAFTHDGIKVREFKDGDKTYYQAVKFNYKYNPSHKKKPTRTVSHNVGKKYSNKKECESALNRMRLRNVMRELIMFLYYGNGEFCWSTSMLPIINVDVDIETIDKWFLDVFRAVLRGNKDIGGLGYEKTKKKGVVTRGTGSNVTGNRQKTDKDIEVWIDLKCMRDALRAGKDVFDCLVNTMLIELDGASGSSQVDFLKQTVKVNGRTLDPKEWETDLSGETDIIGKLQTLFDDYYSSATSEKSSKSWRSYFKAKPDEELSLGEMVLNGDRCEKAFELECFMLSIIRQKKWEEVFNKDFFYYKNNGMVVLKQWFGGNKEC